MELPKIIESDYLDLCKLISNENINGDEFDNLLNSDDRLLSLIYLLNKHWLMATFEQKIKENHLWLALDEHLQSYILEITEVYKVRSINISNEINFIIETLNNNNIHSILIKGGANLFNNVANPPYTRFMSDVDILIPQESIIKAYDLLKSIGYTNLSEEDSLIAKEHHHLPALFNITEGSCQIELHKDILMKTSSYLLSTKEAILKSEPLQINNKLFSHQLHPNHQLILAIVHAEVSDHGYAENFLNLKMLYDLTQIIKRFDDRLNWEIIYKKFEDENSSEILVSVLYSLNILFKINILENKLNNKIPATYITKARLHFEKCVHSKSRIRKKFDIVVRILNNYTKKNILLKYGGIGYQSYLKGIFKQIFRHFMMLLDKKRLKRFIKKFSN